MGRRGATLVEVMVAALVLAVALMSFIGVTAVSTTQGGFNREWRIAAADLQSAVEDSFSVKFSDFTTKPYPTGFPNGSTLTAYTNKHLRNETITITYLSQTPQTLTYQLVLSYTNFNGRTETRSITTRRIW